MIANRKIWWGADALLLIMLAVYVYVGVPLTPYHGDEGMQIYASLDYHTAIVEGNPRELLTNPPYTIDSRPHLRLLNGTIQRYVAGFTLYTIRGHNEGDLPISPGWNWGLSYEDNVAGGWMPKDSILYPTRFTSASFFALSIVAVFALGKMLGGRAIAYPAALLYGLNPVLLVNARRAMLEGSSLFFGVLVALLAALMAYRLVHGRFPNLFWWGGLALVGGLAIASKHSTAIYLVGAWLWVFAAAVIASVKDRRWRPALAGTGALAVAGVLAIVFFVVFSPALWNDPPARLGNLVETRAEMLEIQIIADEKAPTPVAQRALWLVTQPFIAPTMYFEVASWAEADDIVNRIAGYERAGVAGLPTGYALGLPLTLLMVLGMGLTVWQARESALRLTFALGLFAWYGTTAGALLLNPLPWQRYYLPLLPAVMLFAGVGAGAIMLWICQQLPTQSGQSAVAGESVVHQTK